MNNRVFVAGHRGLVGAATCRALERDNSNFEILTRSHAQLDLQDPQATTAFFQEFRPNHVIMCAAKVGGIMANNKFPVDFLHENLQIQLNVFNAAHQVGVDRFIFLGSSCIYPRDCPQPISEEYLLTGPLEATNRAYALAKIAGVESCWSFNRQHRTRYIALMPTNLYGIGDNYHPEHSHVLPALIRRFHEAKVNGSRSVTVWGSGSPRREFLFSEDLGEAIRFILTLPDPKFSSLTSADAAPLINVGCGEDSTIRDLAHLVRDVVGFEGVIEFDTTKPDGTPRKLLNTERINALGWQPTTSLVDGLRAAYTNFLSNWPTQKKVVAVPGI